MVSFLQSKYGQAHEFAERLPHECLKQSINSYIVLSRITADDLDEPQSQDADSNEANRHTYI